MPPAPAHPADDGGSRTWLHQALREHEDRTLKGAALARTLVFSAIGIWIYANYGPEIARENLLPLVLFVLLGVAAFLLMHRRPGRAYLSYLFVVLDAALLGYVLFAPGRTYPPEWPWPVVLRLPIFLFFLTLPALAALTFRPILVLWAGAVVAATLAGSAWLIAASPGAVVGLRDSGEGSRQAVGLARYLAPHYIHPDDIVVRVFVVLLVSAIIAYAAAGARRLIFEQAGAARERANLARYLAPTMVDRLARQDNPLGQVRRQEVAVLFCDIRGFTTMAEALQPEAVMALLRDFHGRMADAVFAHGGTLDKFTGDGLMATFGTPETAPDDAARALACTRSMLAALALWNRERAAGGLAAVEAGIGLHGGPVTTGDIGGAQRFEFAVVGDTVNVAQRLQELARPLGSALVASEAVLRRAGVADPSSQGFVGLDARPLRGRAAPLALWALRAQSGTTLAPAVAHPIPWA